jgi:hypothetical protein
MVTLAATLTVQTQRLPPHKHAIAVPHLKGYLTEVGDILDVSVRLPLGAKGVAAKYPHKNRNQSIPTSKID